MKCFLKVCMSLSIFLALLLLGGTNWYFMSIVVMEFLNAHDASLSMIRKPGFIPRFFISVVNYVKSLTIYLSLLFFIGFFTITFKSYTYMK